MFEEKTSELLKEFIELRKEEEKIKLRKKEIEDEIYNSSTFNWESSESDEYEVPWWHTPEIKQKSFQLFWTKYNITNETWNDHEIQILVENIYGEPEVYDKYMKLAAGR